jgi:hypothetical protein
MESTIIPTHQIGTKVIDLVQAARRRVVLVSPYFRVWGHLENALQQASRQSVQLNVVFRRDKREEYRDLVDQLHKLSARVFDFKDLHAKVYVNESACILTSMNLYDYSAQNSEEFAIQSSSRELVQAVNGYVDDLIVRSEEIRQKSILARALQGTVRAAQGVAAAVLNPPGTCIRCGEDIDFNPDKPLCSCCYQAWARYKNAEFKEKHCHSCGKPTSTSFSKPLCQLCYKEQH